MFLHLGEIDATPVELKGQLQLAELRGGGGDPLIAGPVEFRGTARRGSLGVELLASWAATVRQRCSRCLESVESRRAEDFFLVLTPKSLELDDLEHEMQSGDADLYHVEGERAEILEIVAEQIQLSLPLKPICRPECEGLCPTCGANRNRIECGCRRDEVDPRLAPLLDLKNRIGGG